MSKTKCLLDRSRDGGTSFGLVIIVSPKWGHFLEVLRILRRQLLELGAAILHECFVPHADGVELLLGDDDLVELLEGVRLQVEHSEHPHAVASDLFDLVSVEGQSVELGEGAQFLYLLQVQDVVSVQIESLEAGEASDDLVFNALQVVITQVDPLKAGRVPHHVFQNAGQVHDRAELVLLQE